MSYFHIQLFINRMAFFDLQGYNVLGFSFLFRNFLDCQFIWSTIILQDQ